MKILAFGIAKDIFNEPLIEIDIEEETTVHVLQNLLEEKYPKLRELGSYMVAVNNEYASGSDLIHENDEVAIIPPVSGG